MTKILIDKEIVAQALEAHIAMKDWIDAVPKDVQLPTMPGFDRDWLDTVDPALRQALEQSTEQSTEQEPVAWMYEQARFGPTDLRGQQWRLALFRLKPWDGDGLVRNVQALYTSPPQRQPLTDEQIGDIAALFYAKWRGHEGFARAIEAAHGIGEKE